MITSSSNAAQIDYWNGDVGRRWAQLQNRLDGLFVEVTALAMAAAAAQPGERALDVGCGCGATLLELARRVGSSGHVTGLDVSEVMLDVARQRIAAEGLGQAEATLADAATHRFEPVTDLVFSRFGVMFFDAPAAAFTNIRLALKPGGRLVFACWRAMEQNDWVMVPLGAARPHLGPEEGPPADPEAPGPFAFADPERLRSVLTAAGFSRIDIVPEAPMLRLGSSGEMTAAADLITRIGPVSHALKDIDDVRAAAVRRDVAKVLEAHEGPQGIVLSTTIWVVTARV